MTDASYDPVAPTAEGLTERATCTSWRCHTGSCTWRCSLRALGCTLAATALLGANFWVRHEGVTSIQSHPVQPDSTQLLGPLERLLQLETKADADVVVHKVASVIGDVWTRQALDSRREAPASRTVGSSRSVAHGIDVLPHISVGSSRNVAHGIGNGVLPHTPARGENDSGEEAERDAECAFAIWDSLNSVGTAILNLMTTIRTCKPKVSGLLLNTFHTDVCAINIEMVTLALTRIANSIASSVSACPEHSNIDATCSAAVVGLLQIAAGMAAGSQIVNASCNEDAMELGEKVKLMWDRADSLQALKGRRLYLGGTKAVSMAQCVFDASQIAANVGHFGLNTDDSNAECPAKDLEDILNSRIRQRFPDAKIAQRVIRAVADHLSNSDLKRSSEFENLNDEVESVTTAGCAASVASTLKSAGQIASYLSISVVHCPHKPNMGAICSAGIGIIISCLTGIVEAASGVYLACDVGQKSLRERPELRANVRRVKKALREAQVPTNQRAQWKELVDDVFETGDFSIPMSNLSVAAAGRRDVPPRHKQEDERKTSGSEDADPSRILNLLERVSAFHRKHK
eukprot:TRINITY_DN107407_c0_g1_i1.p1 TRINITY_DN107407_c0_g1~~TRINITY_DN107407_c0_g1_i1.p1  ORF type:complete len:574 (-),score=87.66 TRINITY_DN107407_c0_g1_i1:43-1764(-)